MAQDPGQYENTQEVEVVLNDPRIKASIPSLLRYLSTKQNIVTVIAADMIGDASSEFKPYDYLFKISKSTRSALLQLKQSRCEQLGIPAKILNGDSTVHLDFASLLTELTQEEIQLIVTTVIEAEGPLDFPFLLKPLQSFLEELLEEGFVRSCEMVFNQNLLDLKPVYEIEIAEAIVVATLWVLALPAIEEPAEAVKVDA